MAAGIIKWRVANICEFRADAVFLNETLKISSKKNVFTAPLGVVRSLIDQSRRAKSISVSQSATIRSRRFAD